MADRALRDRERAARLDPSREPELLRERVRAVTLAPEKLELAAYCGSEAARVALEWPPCPTADLQVIRDGLASGEWLAVPARLLDGARAGEPAWLALEFGTFVNGLSRWGKAVAAALAALGHEERRHGWLWDPAGRCYRHDEDSFTAVAVESSEFSRLVAATEERAP